MEFKSAEGLPIVENKNIEILGGRIATIDKLIEMSDKDAKKFAVLTFCEMFLNDVTVKNFLKEDEDNDLINRVKLLREKVREGKEKEDYEELEKIIEEIKNIFNKLQAN